MVNSCSAVNCTNRQGKITVDGKKLQFHKFPLKKPDLLKKWILAVRRGSWQPSSTSNLCGEHFLKTDYKSNAQHYLNEDAVPSVFSFSKHLQRVSNKRRIISKHPTCNPALMHIWRQVIPRSDRVMTKKDRVCDLHFAKEDIEWDFIHENLPEGKRLHIKRDRHRLKPGAIPTNFQNLPKYSNNLRKLVSQLPKHALPTKKPSKVICAIQKELHDYYFRGPQSKDANNVSGIEKNCITKERKKKNEKSNQDLVSNDVNETLEETTVNEEESCDVAEDILNTSVLGSNINSNEFNSEDMTVKSEKSEIMAEEDLHTPTNNTNAAVVGEVTYDVLVSNLELIPKPNSSWGITAHDRFIVCAKWNEEYMLEKRVIIDCNLNIKVYVKDKEIASYKNWVFRSLSDVTHIMHLIDL